MQLICDYCNFAYSFYAQHEKVADIIAKKDPVYSNGLRPNVCYCCARRIKDISNKIFCNKIPEE